MTLTPEQFNLLATKKEFGELKDKVDDIDKKIDSLISTIDANTKSFKDHDESHAMNDAAHRRFEKRISALEGKPVEALDVV